MGDELIALYSSPELRQSKEVGAVRANIGRILMIAGKQNRIVLVTCGSIVEARKIANDVVGKRLAACANIVLGPVQSIYRWKGKVQSAREVLMLLKTSANRLE